MPSKKVRIAGVVVGVAVVGGALAFGLTRDRRNRIVVQTQKVARHDLTATVTASGEIRPKRYVNVSSDVPGRITRLLVREGDTVRLSQPLCHIDATRLEAMAKQAEAGLQALRSDLRRAEADLDVGRLVAGRTQKMHDDQLVSDQTLDQAQADIKMKTAAVETIKRRIAQQEAALESDRDNLQKTRVLAPMSGVVTALLKEEGETVIGAQSFQPTVIMTVADLSEMEVEILVDETDIRDLKLGQTAAVRVDALPDAKIKGEVTEIGASALVRGAQAGQSASSAGNQAKDFKVTVTLKEPPKTLRPGLNATADITTAKKEKVVAVPIQAVVVREVDKEGKVVDPGTPQQQGERPNTARDANRPKGEEQEGVFVLTGGEAQFRTVKTGILGETEIEVVDGLKEGDEIVSGSYRTLRTLKNKAKVRSEQGKKGKA